MNLIELYTQALEIELNCSQSDYLAEQQLPISDRIQKGITMTNLSAIFEFYDNPPDEYCPSLDENSRYIKRVHISSLCNISKLREGSQVKLSHGSYSFNLQIVEDSVLHFVLEPAAFERKNCFLPYQDHPQHQWQIDAIETTATFNMLRTTADFLANNLAKTKQIEELLDGEYTCTNNETLNFNESSLNSSQNNAIQQALQSDYIHLIQGPPGTGKTHTIAHLCNTLLKQNKNIFITGPTHTAINNCLDKIATVVKNPSQVIKVGERYQSNDIQNTQLITITQRLPYKNYQRNIAYSHEGIVIGATPYTLCYPATKRLDEWEFDYAIIDESAQMSIPMAIAVMAHCERIILVGDHQQLNPILPNQSDNILHGGSIFQKLATLYPNNLSLLNQTYRLNPSLLAVPNHIFYNGLLESHVTQAVPYKSFKTTTTHASVLTNEHALVLFEHEEFDGMGHSPYEAMVIGDLILELINNDVSLNQIAILTPYRAQVRAIRQSILQRGILNERRVQELFVDTVDRMQGQERDYIFYSLANPNPIESEQRLDFFYSANRLNVAITRARIKCIVIANYRVFDISNELQESSQNPTELQRGLEAFTQFRKLTHTIHYNPLDDSDIWV